MKNKLINAIIGLIPVFLLWIIVYNNRNEYGYGMAILPLIIISIILFIVFFFIGKLIYNKFNK